MANLVNSELPINIKTLESLVDRIYKRYPMIDKTQISVIVRAALESIRELLILGNVINFNKFVFNMKLHFFTHYYKKLRAALKVKLSTPPSIKRNKDV